MLTGQYKIADIKKDSTVIKHLTDFENEIAKKIGGDVVLIAYQREEKELD